jgi:signal transduction histidine kinase
VVPAAVVAVLGYVSLRQWEASAELLLREQAREMASMAAEKVERVVRQADDELLGRLQAILAAPDPGQARLAAFVAGTPLIERLYLVDRGGARRFPAAWTAEDAEVYAQVRAEISDGFWDRGDRRDFFAGRRPVLAAVLRGADGAPLLAALCRDVAVLGREMLERTLGAVEAVAVLDQAGRAVFSRGLVPDAEPIAAVTLREPLPAWRVALYQPPGVSPRAAVRRQVMALTGALGVLLVVIAGGIVAAGRLVRRETEMARLKADFVANVSHDLKTPLSVIRMFAETLDMGRLPDEARRREYYRVISRESERLSRLIDNVLDFSRIEGGRRRYDIAPAAVEPLVREAVEAFDYPLAQQGFKVDVRVAPDLPEVPMDAAAVGQALANLVDNAIKYSAERRSLLVEAALDGSWLTLSVADEGIGIPAAEHARIFEKFYRIGRSETQGRRGSGVGLALVRHVAEAHGGEVTVRSAPGAGSRFTLRLPLEPR